MAKKKAKKKAAAKPKYSVHALLRANALLSKKIKLLVQDVEHLSDVASCYYREPPGGEALVKSLQKQLNSANSQYDKQRAWYSNQMKRDQDYIQELQLKIANLEKQLASVSPKTD